MEKERPRKVDRGTLEAARGDWLWEVVAEDYGY